MRIAVIGSGISGMAAAYYLSRRHDVSLFEKDARLGGHTNTIMVESSRGPLAVDTGFIVHNDRNYPNLVKLFAELGVETQASDMSFAVTCRSSGFEYSSRGVRGFFAQRSNLCSAEHYKLFGEILRFNRTAPKVLRESGADRATLGDFLDDAGFNGVFTEKYLFPMASAVWSTSLDAIRSFPAATLLRFFDNHGMLGINTHPKWRVLRGGSHRYLAPIAAPYKDRIYRDARIVSVARTEAQVALHFADRPMLCFDQVVFACHGDQVLPLLESPSDGERDILTNFTTSSNEACLHTDASLLPRRADARASWNYNLGLNGRNAATLTYDMNRLQSLDVEERYCVTLNAGGAIDPERIVERIVYHHPLYTREAVTAQGRWGEISGVNRTHFCGAYWLYGFHEDGLNSAVRVARSLGVDC